MEKYSSISKLLILPLLAALLLSSCTSSGFLSTSEPMQGDVARGVYTGKIGSDNGLGTFSIFIPQSTNSYEYPYMQTKQKIENDSTYVSFGPAATDFTIYRVIVGINHNNPLKAFREKSMPELVSMTQQAYKSPMKRVLQKNVRINGRPAIYEVYTQYIPGGWEMLNETSPQTYTHAVLFVDYGKYVAMLWIQASDAGTNIVNNNNREEIKNLSWAPMRKFIRSLKIQAN